MATAASASPDPTPKPKADADSQYASPAYHPAIPGVYQPHYPAPHYGGYAHPQPAAPPVHHHPQPSYLYEEEDYPKQNCTVVDETLKAEICIPDFSQNCEKVASQVSRLEMGEFCYNVTRTVCTEEDVTSEIEVCDVEYAENQSASQAKTVEVVFEKECTSQMVTVCQPKKVPAPTPEPKPAYPPYGHPPPSHPAPYGHSYGGYGGYAPGPHHYNDPYATTPAPKPKEVIVEDCQEVSQETCFNLPKVKEVSVDVSLSFPEPSRNCETREVTIPTVTCEDIVSQKCQDIPRVVSAPDSFERCNVDIGEPKCEEIELVLPKQICKDIVYGYAHVPYEEGYGQAQGQGQGHPETPPYHASTVSPHPVK